MTFFDLTHLMFSGMPVYPGKKPAGIQPSATLSRDGYREKHISIDGHTGTHMDAPAHMLPNGNTLDQYQISKFCGTAIILPVQEEQISLEFLASREEDLKRVDFVLFNSGWSKYWGKPEYLQKFPTLTIPAAQFLTRFSLKRVGMDMISADPIDSTDFPIHHILFESDMVILENLKFPEKMPLGTGILHAYPLNLADADGSPIRAVLSIEIPNQ